MSPAVLPHFVRAAAALVAAGAGLVSGGPALAGEALLWYAGFVVNFALMAGLAHGTASRPSLALAWGVKLPLTLGAVALLLPFSSPLALVLGLFAAVNALVATALLAGPPRTVEA
jgi:hypothetical protein